MKKLSVLHLYPNELNTYGDHGNRLVLTKRMKLHGYEPKILFKHPGGAMPKDVDIVIGGGGQDSAQTDVQKDILKIGGRLHEMAKDNVPMLLICGTYQLFCHRYVISKNKVVKGIGIFDAETVAGEVRMIGNIAVETSFGILYGFENHSGQTFLNINQAPLGKVKRGNGNNGKDKTEGARTNNVFGTYLHGPVLPNNPIFCDELIGLAAKRRYGAFIPANIDESLSDTARAKARRRKY